MALIGFEGQIRLEVDKVSFCTKLSKFVYCAPSILLRSLKRLNLLHSTSIHLFFVCLESLFPLVYLSSSSRFFEIFFREKTILSQSDRTSSQDIFLLKKIEFCLTKKLKTNLWPKIWKRKSFEMWLLQKVIESCFESFHFENI